MCYDGGFYIFTIITDGAHQIITLRMTPTTIPAERSLTYIFTTFANVARHASSTRCSGEMSSLSLICYSPPLSDSWVPQLISLPYGTHTSALSPTSGNCPSVPRASKPTPCHTHPRCWEGIQRRRRLLCRSRPKIHPLPLHQRMAGQ